MLMLTSSPRNSWLSAGRLWKQTQPTPQPALKQPKYEVTKVPSSPGEWTEVVRREAKVTTLPPKQDVLDKSAAKQKKKKQDLPSKKEFC